MNDILSIGKSNHKKTHMFKDKKILYIRIATDGIILFYNH